jgi:hypothetical protein
MPTAPTRKTGSSATASTPGARLTPASLVVREATFTAPSTTLTLANTVGIGVGMFASTAGAGVVAGSIVTEVTTTTVTIDRNTDDADTADVTFTRVPPAPTRKSS